MHNTPEDLMMNTARMCDASQFSRHRISVDIASLNFNLAIMNGVQQDIDSRKQANISGRGRGRAHNNRGRSSLTNRQVSLS